MTPKIKNHCKVALFKGAFRPTMLVLASAFHRVSAEYRKLHPSTTSCSASYKCPEILKAIEVINACIDERLFTSPSPIEPTRLALTTSITMLERRRREKSCRVLRIR